jgi:hypothetical protein
MSVVVEARCVYLPVKGVRRHGRTLTDRPNMFRMVVHATVKPVGPTCDQWSEFERSSQAGWAATSLLAIIAMVMLAVASVTHRAAG